MTAAELKELLSAPKVKPLVWEGDGHWVNGPDEGWAEEACTPFGWGYSIEFGLPDEGIFVVDSTFEKRLTGFETPEDAKAAAQADYEARILSALEPQPQIAAALIETMEGLRWYADETAYDQQCKPLPCGCCSDLTVPASDDRGANARATLSRIDAILEGKG